MTNLPARLRNEAQLVHGQRRDLLIEAASMIEAMAQPTQAMIDAGAYEAFENPTDTDRAMCRDVFLAMLKEAQS